MKESSLPVAPSPMPVKNRRTFHLICKCILYLVLNSEHTKISGVWLKETKKGTASRLSPSILYFLILRAIDKHGRRLSICANVFIFFEVEKLIWCFFQKNSVRVGELFSVWNSDCCWKRKGNSLPATPFFQSSFRLNPKMNCSPNKSFAAKIGYFFSLIRNGTKQNSRERMKLAGNVIALQKHWRQTKRSSLPATPFSFLKT